GVVGIVAPEAPPLLGLVRRLAPALCAGNTVLVVVSERHPLPGLTLGEVLATSDFPAGTVNVVSGIRRELLPWLASHMDVNAVDVTGCTPEETRQGEELAAANVKRVVHGTSNGMTPDAITAVSEMKTVWHPLGVWGRTHEDWHDDCRCRL